MPHRKHNENKKQKYQTIKLDSLTDNVKVESNIGKLIIPTKNYNINDNSNFYSFKIKNKNLKKHSVVLTETNVLTSQLVPSFLPHVFINSIDYKNKCVNLSYAIINEIIPGFSGIIDNNLIIYFKII